VVEQVRFVRERGCLDEILALKICRREAWRKVLRVLRWLESELPGAVLRDPANRSNVVSDVMTKSEKWRVAHAAWVAGRAA
jgi:hypothetical protein